jgi:hypothetical protein
MPALLRRQAGRREAPDEHQPLGQGGGGMLFEFGAGPIPEWRRFGPDGLYGCRTLSRSSMKLYWGGHIENMVSFARQRFQEGTMISYKYSKNRPAALVQGKHVKGVSLSVISYLASQGKYQVDKNQHYDHYF